LECSRYNCDHVHTQRKLKCSLVVLGRTHVSQERAPILGGGDLKFDWVDFPDAAAFPHSSHSRPCTVFLATVEFLSGLQVPEEEEEEEEEDWFDGVAPIC